MKFRDVLRCGFPFSGAIVLALGLTLAAAWPAAAEEPGARAGWTDFGPLNKEPYDVAVAGNYAYTADTHGLTIYDISDRTHPVRTGDFLLKEVGRGVAVSGSIAYVADEALEILDVSDPKHPTLQSSTDVPGDPTHLAVSGHTLYTAGFSLCVLDVTDPRHPSVLGTLDTPGTARGIVLSGSLLYIASGPNGLLIVDVSNPAKPSILGTLDTGDSAYDVAVSGSTVYVANGNSGLMTVDVSNPAKPVKLGSYDTPYLSTGIAVSGTTVYVGDYSSLQLIDVSDPAHPSLVGLVEGTPRFLAKVAVSGNTVWGVDFAVGVEGFDVSDPSNPALVSSLFTTGDATAVTAAGHFLYVADDAAGLQIIDIADPEYPVVAGGIPLESWTDGIAISGTMAYVADFYSGLKIVDVSDPAHPQLVGEAEVPERADDVRVAATTAYVADGRNGLVTFDVSNPGAPRQLGSWPMPNGAKSIVLAGSTAVVANYQVIQLLDVSDPGDPELLATIPDVDISQRGLALSGNLLFAADERTLRIYDISDPGAPVVLGSVETQLWITGVAVAGSTVLVAGEGAAWETVDVSNPANPVLVGSPNETWRGPTGITVSADRGTFWLTEGPIVEGYSMGLDFCPTMTVSVSPQAVAAGGSTATVTVHVTDNSGNPVTGEQFVAWPASGSLTAFTDHGNGTYTATYTSGDIVGWVDIPVSVADTYCTATGTVHVTFPANPTFSDHMLGNYRMIPGSAHIQGAHGTSWRSDAVLHNPGPRAAAAALFFLEGGKDNSQAVGRPVTVPAGGSLALDDFVLSTFGRDGASGAVLVTSDEPLLVTSRTYNDAASGTYGQLVPGISTAGAIRGDTVVRLIQLTRNGDFHTNIGFANATDTPLHVTVELHRADGTLIGSPDYTIPPMGFYQKTDILGTDADDAYAIVSSDTSGARYFTYASVVDNRSGDPIFVLPVEATTESLMIPAAAAVHGLAGTNWRTDLELHNAGSFAAFIDVYPLLRGQANPNPDAKAFRVEPGESLRLDDVLGKEFGISGAAALLVSSSSFSPIMVTSRTYNDTSTKTYGQFIPALPLTAATGAVRGGRLVQLSQSATDDTGFRTNIGLTNATDTATDVVIALYDGAGHHLGDVPQHLEPYEYVQIDRIFRKVTGAAVDNGYAIVSSSTPGAGFYAYASVVDNVSGDPINIPAMW